MARNGSSDETKPGAEQATGGETKRSRTAWIWSSVVIAFVVLVFLLIFILQNFQNVTVRFLGFAGTLPLGVAMLFAVIGGALLVALAGTARILQLRREARKAAHSGPAAKRVDDGER
ncbi:LapA family protein [Saccharopolyspora griseoalba]|uniref:Lipopolysaccharide assembly LapA domain-containing protein n=1 Tax=Saccharopolyspora griseoalba TaxID=1431848 RepID=A0ABW2LP02_9PSEU